MARHCPNSAIGLVAHIFEVVFLVYDGCFFVHFLSLAISLATAPRRPGVLLHLVLGGLFAERVVRD